ncbi:glycosyltransferase family 2 protein [Neptuniibacter halophilus]|uniref:glycosyltransferase family 2 protein n=1 Tax=Neptuniibacter halophilus TaxID=651666 RepID=UPI002572AA2D|nr:glycosyltransferase family 2 protein [Neptuniibacter halophilus]
MNKEPLSAVIITLNEASNIADCIASLSFCDEVVVVDSGSTDDTVAISESLGCRVVVQQWLGFGKQKQFAVEQARHHWVLCLDADERISPELQQSIEHFMRNPASHACQMPRRNRFMGRWLYHGEGYPDISLRLFHRAHAAWSDDPVHEKVVSQAEPATLSGDILHFSQETLEQYLNKQNRYTSLQAEQLFQKGKKIGVAKLLLSPLLRFIKFYLIRQGFRDGLPGLVHILIGCLNSFSKYAKTIEKIKVNENK